MKPSVAERTFSLGKTMGYCVVMSALVGSVDGDVLGRLRFVAVVLLPLGVLWHAAAAAIELLREAE